MSTLKRRYGWTPDTPDHRDMLYMAPVHVKKALPDKVDLRSNMPKVYDQGSLGSCTANAIGAAHQFNQRLQKQKDWVPSRLFLYYNERRMEGTVNVDAGAMIRDGMKSVATEGLCPEKLWVYDVRNFKAKPDKACYTEALKHQGLVYSRVIPTEMQMMSCLAEGFPFVFGFTVYESFESDAVAKTGIMPMPTKKERALGGHAVLAVGYDQAKRVLIVRNSWSDEWGDKGHFYMPFDYATSRDLADDFWTLRSIEV